MNKLVPENQSILDEVFRSQSMGDRREEGHIHIVYGISSSTKAILFGKIEFSF